MQTITLLNIVNAADLTNWFKAFTWGDTVTTIRFADIKRCEFVSENSDAVARMMAHSYIKKYIPFYMNELVGTSALTVPSENTELSNSVRAAADGGFAPYIFNAENVPAEFTSKIKKLNIFLYDAALEYIAKQTANKDANFVFDIQYLIREFPDCRQALIRARWKAKTSSVQSATNINALHQSKNQNY